MVKNKKKEITDFSLKIETLCKEKQIPYMDAILMHCHNTGLEIETAAKLINSNVKARIKIEAEDLNFLEKPKIKRIPI